MIEHVFDDWQPVPDVEIYRPMDRAVIVDGLRLWSTGPRFDTIPPGARQHGLRVDALHSGRQRAWIRTAANTWVAVVDIEAYTRDGLNTLPITLWLMGHQLQLPH